LKQIFHIFSIQVRRFDVDDISLKPVGNTFKAAVTDASGSLSGEYMAGYKTWFIKMKNQGRITATFSKVSIAASVTLTTNGEVYTFQDQDITSFEGPFVPVVARWSNVWIFDRWLRLRLRVRVRAQATAPFLIRPFGIYSLSRVHQMNANYPVSVK